MKGEGAKFHVVPKIECANYKMNQSSEELSLDLYDALKNISKDNMIPYELSAQENGKNYPKFDMKIERFVWGENKQTPQEKKEVGVWKSGFEEKDAIHYVDGLDLIDHLAHTVFRIVTVVVSKQFT